MSLGEAQEGLQASGLQLRRLAAWRVLGRCREGSWGSLGPSQDAVSREGGIPTTKLVLGERQGVG